MGAGGRVARRGPGGPVTAGSLGGTEVGRPRADAGQVGSGHAAEPRGRPGEGALEPSRAPPLARPDQPPEAAALRAPGAGTRRLRGKAGPRTVAGVVPPEVTPVPERASHRVHRRADPTERASRPALRRDLSGPRSPSARARAHPDGATPAFRGGADRRRGATGADGPQDPTERASRPALRRDLSGLRPLTRRPTAGSIADRGPARRSTTSQRGAGRPLPHGEAARSVGRTCVATTSARATRPPRSSPGHAPVNARGTKSCRVERSGTGFSAAPAPTPS